MVRTLLSAAARTVRIILRVGFRVVLPIGIVAAAVFAVVVVARRDDEAVVPAAALSLEAAPVELGDLVTTERIDGTLVETGTRTIVHRIEGQTSSGGATTSTAPVGTASGSATAAPAIIGFASTAVRATTDAQTAPTCTTTSTVPEATTPVTTTSVPGAPASTTPNPTESTVPAAVTTVPSPEPTTPPASTTLSTTDPNATDPNTTVPNTTDPNTTDPNTTDPNSTSTTSPPASSVPADCPPDPSTTTTTTTVVGPVVPSGAGQAPSGGGGGPTPSDGSTAGAATSSDRIEQLVTWVAAPGTTVTAGDAIYSIEGAPVRVLLGSLPAWRSMSSDVDDGADVLQLEQNLVALGFDPDGELVVDAEFDDQTERAVERWQAVSGVEVTGEVALGSVVFVPAASTIASVSATIGDRVGDGDAIVSLAGDAQEVVITVPTELQSALSVATAVDVEGTPGLVTALRSAELDGAVTVEAVVTPSSPLPIADGAVATVEVTQELANSVLIVPVEALVSRLDGTYAVQVADDAAGHRFVAVDVVGVSDGDAGVSGDLAAGDDVLVPA